jgi:hypothetical protein
MTEIDTIPEEDALRRLLVSALDGDASDAQMAQLNELLGKSEQLRHLAATFMLDDFILAKEMRTVEEALAFLTQPLESLSDIRAGATRERRILPADSQSTANQIRRSAWRSFRPVTHTAMWSALRVVNDHGLAVLAAMLLVTAGLGWHYWRMQSQFDRLYSSTS